MSDAKDIWSKLTVDPSQALELLKLSLESGTTAMMWGQYGVGKTSVVYQLSDALKKMTNPALRFEGCVVINPSQSDIIDFKLPYVHQVKDTNEVLSRFAYSEILPTAGRWVIFVDEINTAPQSLQPSLYSLILEGRIGNYKLPDGCFRIAAGNREEDQCAAQPMSAALKDRLNLHMFVVPNSKSWGAWAQKHNIRPEIQAWVQYSPGVLNGHNPKDPTGGCTPRSLEALSKKMYGLEKNKLFGTELESIVVNGTIGQGAASEFEGFLAIYRTETKLDDILKDPKNAPVPERMDILYCIVYSLADKIDEKNAVKIFEYLKRLPPSYTHMAVKLCQAKDATKIWQIPEIRNFVVQNLNMML